jgi:signal transduction histidine kinase
VKRRNLAIGVTIAIVAVAFVGWSQGPSKDSVSMLVVQTVVTSMVAAAIGWWIVGLTRGRRIVVQIVGIALVASLTTVAGVFAAVWAMFLSGHDLQVISMVLAASTTVAVVGAMVMARSLAQSALDVSALARQLTGPTAFDPPTSLASTEFRQLANELSVVSNELEVSRQRERALDAARRELVTWVSHDLRSPIASIRAMAEALEDGVVDDATTMRRYFRNIHHESERLGGLVDDLFELNRINSGTYRFDGTTVPLDELLGDVIERAAASAAARGIDVVNASAEMSSAMVPATDLQRVLHNVLDNAIRHTPAGGTVMMDVAVVDGTAEISISDECGGIPEADLPRVFEVAFRSDASRQRDHGGGGLGLAIAKGLLDHHHGSIDVANQTGGCRFVLRLPVEEHR